MAETTGLWCVNIQTAARLMDVSRMSVYRWSVQGKLRSHVWQGHSLVPLMDLAKILDVDEGVLIDRLTEWGVPVWRCWVEDDGVIKL